MLVGIDDTDSLKGGCTTYIASVLLERLMGEKNIEFFGNLPKKLINYRFPRLIRLNPNIPYKTRGNGAVAFFVSDEDIDDKKEIIIKFVEKHSYLKDKNTNPGIVFLKDYNKISILNGFYRKAVSELVSMEYAEIIAKRVNADVYRFNNGSGIIGALAAIGADLSKDKTYELLAYRKKENYGKEKRIDKNSVFRMNYILYPETFDNVDLETEQILITPKGYDPVFCGIRGESPEIVKKAFGTIKPLEDIERIQIFETNQATDAHLRERRIYELNAYDCAILNGVVSREPKTIEGGHVIFGLKDNTGEIDCAAYEPTGNFRDVIRKLIVGDRIRVYGGIGKYLTTLNLEKIQIMKLGRIYKKEVPVCCGKKMTSVGKGKGFKCKKCGKKVGNDSMVLEEISRDIDLGLYEVPPRARRHLSKPLVRILG